MFSGATRSRLQTRMQQAHADTMPLPARPLQLKLGDAFNVLDIGNPVAFAAREANIFCFVFKGDR